jgi:tetratricopeptide (TPR) repeat protein
MVWLSEPVPQIQAVRNEEFRMPKQILRISTSKQHVTLGDQTHQLPPKWVAFLALLGLAEIAPDVAGLPRARDGHVYVSADDVAGLEGFGPNDNSQRKTIRRFIRDDLPKRFAEQQVILSPHGASEKQFRFDSDLVFIEFDRPNLEVAQWLNLKVSSGRPSTRDSGLGRAELALIEALIEAHDFTGAEIRLERLHQSNPDDALMVGVMLTWSFLRERQRNLVEAVNLHNRAMDLLANLETADLEPLADLQRARLARADEDFLAAEKIVRRLLTSVSSEDAFLRGRLETLAGLLHLDRGLLEPRGAEEHFLTALEHFAKIHWWWGVQASCANLGLMWWRQLAHYDQLPNEPSAPQAVAPVIRERWLLEANAWLGRADEYCRLTGLRHESPDLLVYLARTERLLERFDAVSNTLNRAEMLARAWQGERDQLEVLLERAELDWARGNFDLARDRWREVLARDCGAELRTEIRERLRERLEVVT